MKKLLKVASLLTVLLLTHSLTFRLAAQGKPEKRCKYPRDLSEYAWVDKQCRVFTNDKTRIDIDQTCLEVTTAIGSLVVIPNPQNDFWGKEIARELGKPQPQRDKWITRFYELGGGKSPGCK